MKYRSEIDGLRGIAVIPVILFHAGFELFKGGFVGVDVFFVISGYLITTIILEDIEKRKFNLINFYERRARRILPALIFIMLFCIPFSWIWMLPNEMKNFSQSLIAVSLFVSNILFWKKTDYFFYKADEMPLLHTWSLAVEEQFYIFFPIFLIFVWSFGKNKIFWIIFFITLISIVLSEWGWRNQAVANFYLAPTRAWEILAGSISAFIIQSKGIQKNNYLSILGLGAITFSIFVYDKNTPFPSIYTLVPVIGVMLLIIYAHKETLAAKILSSKILVSVGLISYSAYLWHQPLFAFTRIRQFGELSFTMIIAICISILILSGLTYKFIEQPFRVNNGHIFSRKKILFILISSLTLLISIGIIGISSDGYIDRKKFEEIKHIQVKENEVTSWVNFCRSNSISINNISGHVCKIGDKSSEPSGILWGDSFAGSAIFGMNELLIENQKSYIAIISDGCPPVPGISRIDKRFNCRDNRQKNLMDWFIGEKELKEIIWIGNYRNLIDQDKNIFYLDGKKPSLKSLKDQIAKTSKNLIRNNKSVVFVLEGPIFPVDISKYISKVQIYNKTKDISLLYVKASDQRNKIGLTSSFLENIKGINYVDSLDIFCEKDLCHALMDDGSPVVDAGGHIYNDGSLMLAEKILSKIKN